MPRTRLLALALLAPLPAAALRQPMPRPEMCARAAAVVVGEVTGTESFWQADGTIATRADVAVTRVLRGRVPDALSIAYPGGSVGGLTLTVSEAPRLRADARYLFLLAPGDGGRGESPPQRPPAGWRLVGGPDGAIRLGWSAGGVGETEAAAVASLGACGA